MLSTQALLFILVGFIATLALHILKRGIYRKSVLFKMYAVRDQFVMLVADDKLSEDSKVFQYYYKRINILLSRAPNIGFDDVLNVVFIKIKTNNMESSLKMAMKESEEVLNLKELECEEVRQTVESFYLVSKELMLAHSSIIKVLYYLLIKGWLNNFIKKIIPHETAIRIKAVSFIENEVVQLQSAHH